MASLWGNVRGYGSQKVTITERNFLKAQFQSREEFRADNPMSPGAQVVPHKETRVSAEPSLGLKAGK